MIIVFGCGGGGDSGSSGGGGVCVCVGIRVSTRVPIYVRALPGFVLVFLSLMYLIHSPYILAFVALLTKSVTDFWDTDGSYSRSCSPEF